MIISKAIEILELRAIEHNPRLPIDTADSIKLGIEALKRIQHVRIHPWSEIYAPLPGETMPGRD